MKYENWQSLEPLEENGYIEAGDQLVVVGEDDPSNGWKFTKGQVLTVKENKGFWVHFEGYEYDWHWEQFAKLPNISAILQGYAAQNGWDVSTSLKVACEFLDSGQDLCEFENFLKSKSEKLYRKIQIGGENWWGEIFVENAPNEEIMDFVINKLGVVFEEPLTEKLYKVCEQA